MMKRLITLIIAAIFTTGLMAQSPQKMSFQAVVRNAAGELVSNQEVGMRISILQGSPDGKLVYREIYKPNPRTNANGLLSMEIGEGKPETGNFSTIDWSNGPYFLRTETDPTGGTNYSISGSSQLLSVPYALYANSAENYSETDPVFDLSAAADITGGNISDWNAAWGWGNHASAGYLTTFSESDPTWSGSTNLTGNISRTGRVGIGLTAPKAGLHIKGSSHPESFFYLQSDNKQDAGFRIYEGDTTKWHIFNESAAGGLSIRNNKYRSAIFVKQANANVGIGTTLPEAQLHTTGSVRFAGAGRPGNGKMLVSDADGNATWEKKMYKIGEYAHGGVVFWLDESGMHGLVCAIEDASERITWDPEDYANHSTRAKANGIYAGKINTSHIRAVYEIEQNNPHYAAATCVYYMGNNYGDWYLPSKYELNLMYQQRDMIDATAIISGGTQFADYLYWSSTESSTSDAWSQDFNTGSQQSAFKQVEYSIRPIRSF